MALRIVQGQLIKRSIQTWGGPYRSRALPAGHSLAFLSCVVGGNVQLCDAKVFNRQKGYANKSIPHIAFGN
jgi:hypothetical protein